jgi:hypothetical protein
MAGTVHGRPACAVCVEAGVLHDGLCSGCGQQSKFPNTRHCPGCGYNVQARRAIKRLEDSIPESWCRDLFVGFMADSGAEVAPGPASVLAKRNIEGFHRLGTRLSSASELTATSVLTALGVDTSGKKYRALKSWLSKAHEINFSGNDASWHTHQSWVSRRLEAEPVEWIQNALRQFLVYLYRQRDKYLAAGYTRAPVAMALPSIQLAIKYGQWFMKVCAEEGAHSVLEITNRHVDIYSAKRPAAYQGICAFVRYLNQSSHRLGKLSVPINRRRPNSLRHVLDLATRRKFIQSCLAAEEGAALRNSAIALLSYFYIQHLDAVLSLRRENVERRADGLHINFGLGWHEIDPAIAQVVERWMTAWQAPSQFILAGDSDLIFPGLIPHQPYSRRSFSAWLKSTHGLLAREVYATAVHGFIDTGLSDPTVLVSCFGLTPVTAIRYWRDSGEDLGSYLYEETIGRMREEGYFDA